MSKRLSFDFALRRVEAEDEVVDAETADDDEEDDEAHELVVDELDELESDCGW